mmetsp:Transcript_100851/g.308342  ORF Transcript_100851/g.308342 Transcript_100851/m.308342 type:complete len:202 (-) Transcript_100851:87-692(-)
MKLLSLIIYKWNGEKSAELMPNLELGAFNFFQRGAIKEHIKFHSRLSVSRTPLGQRFRIELSEHNIGYCHTFVHPNGLGAAVMVDSEYPERVAKSLLSEATRVFLERCQGKWEDKQEDTLVECPEVAELFLKYQNPAEADKITKIEKDLEDVKETVLKSMDDLCKRGENLDALMQKSADLSSTSVQFYRTAKKNNQCCKMY